MLKARINQRLRDYLKAALPSLQSGSNAADTVQPSLNEAIQYSVNNGGKRLRPLLVYSLGESLGASLDTLDAPAMACELIHCYSLIHDDLPAMDDDEYRRGQLTCHLAFDEATAILAGDALQTLAFDLLSDPNYNPVSEKHQLSMIRVLSKAVGPQGMIAGQALDMASENKTISLSELLNLHQKKTAYLFSAAFQMAAIAANRLDPALQAELQHYAYTFGIAFQIQDDLLDVESTLAKTGKKSGQDAKHHKATFPSILGVQPSKEYLKQLLETLQHCPYLKFEAFFNMIELYNLV